MTCLYVVGTVSQDLAHRVGLISIYGLKSVGCKKPKVCVRPWEVLLRQEERVTGQDKRHPKWAIRTIVSFFITFIVTVCYGLNCVLPATPPKFTC